MRRFRLRKIKTKILPRSESAEIGGGSPVYENTPIDTERGPKCENMRLLYLMSFNFNFLNGIACDCIMTPSLHAKSNQGTCCLGNRPGCRHVL